MRCYNCGANLTENPFCTNCGVDVARYKKIMGAANVFYNEGLERASVRDLSGAIVSLRQCLKLNKNHVEARNLLGLIYFEMGEAVAAMSEWVISKNFRPTKNIADDYIDMIQSNPTRLDSINQTIKKYNQALSYCYQDSLDLAIIQLKKVLSLNPKFVQAHQLLALLYLNSEKWYEAKKELEKCRKIDVNNTITLRYLHEADSMLAVEEEAEGGKRKRKSVSDVVKYSRGNETIIQPLNHKETKSTSVLMNIGIGIVIGILAACFLILPARIQSAKQGMDEEFKKASEQLDVKTATIAELEQKIKTLETENDKLTEQLTGFTGENGTISALDSLLAAAYTYSETPNDTEKIAEYLDQIPEEMVENGSEAFKNLHEYIRLNVGVTIGQGYFNEGMEAYQSESYEDAIDKLSKAFSYDNTNAEALLNLGHAYRKSGDFTNALDVYNRLMELFPNTDRANRAQSFINEINEQQS